MANVIHRSERNSLGYLIRKESVNSPDYSTDSWLHNPNYDSVLGIPEQYWKVEGTPPGGSLVEMTSSEKEAVDSSRLILLKESKKAYLRKRASALIEMRYSIGEQNYLNSNYTKSIVNRPNKKQAIQPWVDWLNYINSNYKNKLELINTAISEEELNSISLDETDLLNADPQLTVEQIESITDDMSLDSFLDSQSVVTDEVTNISGPFYLMQILEHRRDLYNDIENPLHDPSHFPILGEAGILQDHANRILNVELIHGKHSWHRNEIMEVSYKRPKDILFYYGWVNSFNSSINGWNNENVALDIAKYNIVVFGDGVQNPSHGDYSNTITILTRLKELKPDILIFGYVTANQELSSFKTKSDQWNDLGIDGIFLDESGYDYGVSRSEFNERVNYVHGLSSSNIAFANAWNTSHILGVENDASFPNTTFNPSEIKSTLNEEDWILLESFPINTSSYASGYESKGDWIYRGQKAVALRYTYKVNFASVGIINNDNANGQSLFNYQFISSLMWSLEACGTSDSFYGASSASVAYWERPDVSDMGKIWSIYPSVANDVSNSDIFYRYLEHGRISLDFSIGALTYNIIKY
jgi:hypothetical protein